LFVEDLMELKTLELLTMAFFAVSIAGIVGLAIGERNERRRWIRRATLLGVPVEDLKEMDDPAVAFGRMDRSARIEAQLSDFGKQLERLTDAQARLAASQLGVERLRSESPVPRSTQRTPQN
jgi:hypothetical protein